MSINRKMSLKDFELQAQFFDHVLYRDKMLFGLQDISLGLDPLWVDHLTDHNLIGPLKRLSHFVYFEINYALQYRELKYFEP